MYWTRNNSLRSKKTLKRKSRLRRASPKRAKQYREYEKVKKAYLALRPNCERCKNKKATDIHHKAGRVGEWLCKQEFFAAVCRQCHNEIHENGVLSRKQGWIIDSFHIAQDADQEL